MTVTESEDFTSMTSDFRVSAVRVAMMLETARPPEASQLDGHFELPDARTLASLLSLRCEKDDVEELLEMYRLVCHNLGGVTCAWCCKPFDETSSAGLFDGADCMVFPATVPKVLVPQCGHAIHTLCFGSQLVPERQGGPRGLCRRCGLPYGWTSIDVDPMVNAFCLLFGPYVDKRTVEMSSVGEVSHAAVLGIAEVCQAFSLELGGLLSSASAWMLLAKRHDFTEPEALAAVGDAVLRLLAPLPPPSSALSEEGCGEESHRFGGLPPFPCGTAVVCPEDRDEEQEEAGSACSVVSEEAAERRKHLTEVFLADPSPDPDPEPDPEFPEPREASPPSSPPPLPPPMPLVEDGTLCSSFFA